MTPKNETTSINVSLPASQRRFVEADVARGGFASVSEYFRELIRERQRRQGAPKGGSQAQEVDRRQALEAVRTILDLQKKLTLKGLSVEDLFNEGRDA
jgi:Arc/MetJ-type ribon-helix-helix transcriptional regulator